MDTTVEFLSEQDKIKIIEEVIDRFLVPKYFELGLAASWQWLKLLEARGSSIWGADYTEYMVRGRGPNINQDPEAIRRWVGYFGRVVFEPWVKNKGLDLNPYAVAYRVARLGTTIKDKGGTDLLEVLQSQECIDFINTRVRDFSVVQVELEFRRQVKQAFA